MSQYKYLKTENSFFILPDMTPGVMGKSADVALAAFSLERENFLGA
ncbi:hypothetical protein [Catenovulum adriaticum]|uniref:Uncharacterized protein n=1 Tax=Catenovulum adriaticum TaxID=2984846 RepID=A0ABY7ARH5_9ALTE|nr:hypothetical protein [Catenovulum sp. TS8]WAJ72148.1 hypothetical protein OLW01_17875 [Catenovulum sp. TS8]